MDYTVLSNQAGIHQTLKALVLKHQRTTFKKPISNTQKVAFEALLPLLNDNKKPFILDAGCGTGMSTALLSAQHPEALVMGIDKSIDRLNRNKHAQHLYQLDLIAFWQQLALTGIKIDTCYLLYPNPWPKSKHVQRRFHGHAIFPTLLNLCENIEVRSNWKIYCDEFAFSAGLLTGKTVKAHGIEPQKALTRFEEKYLLSKTPIYQVNIGN